MFKAVNRYILPFLFVGVGFFSFPVKAWSYVGSVIYLYNGPGTSEESVLHTEFTIRTLVDQKYKITKIGPVEVARGEWVQNAAMFIIPGGADIPYSKHLKLGGNQQIKSYVEKGGAFLGFCAGAYYGSAKVEFALHTPLEVVGLRELSFFPGKAIGPTLADYDYKSASGARAAEIRWDSLTGSIPKNKNFLVYYNGGGHFENVSLYKNVTTLAWYGSSSKNKAAIVEVSVGKGKVILSGVHCEYSPYLLNKKDPFLAPIQKKLLSKEKERTVLMTHLLERLNIKVRKQEFLKEATNG